MELATVEAEPLLPRSGYGSQQRTERGDGLRLRCVDDVVAEGWMVAEVMLEMLTAVGTIDDGNNSVGMLDGGCGDLVDAGSVV
ncbi:hypothetical protein PIB30_047402 [Stylosanthes scabra]|uniref:Uncharacterized protein n=1 Tax=Stylosanthes scabra TaxID=79078 RepID=A0ABU6RGR9_9FABA|nr:hypothetical protein [Stylosanthes scabra]